MFLITETQLIGFIEDSETLEDGTILIKKFKLTGTTIIKPREQNESQYQA